MGDQSDSQKREEAAKERLESRRVRQLVRVGTLLTSTLELDRLLNLIVSSATEVVSAEAASLVLIEPPDSDQLKFVISVGGAGEEVKEYRYKLGEGIIGWVAQEGRPILSQDVSEDSRWSSIIAEDTGFPTKSIACVPLTVKERTIGALEALNCLTKPSFNKDDLALLSAFAGFAASTIENARLYESLSRRVDDAHHEIMETNRRLAQQMAELEAVIQGMADGLLVVDNDGRIVRINQVAQAMFGLAESESIGTRVTERIRDPVIPTLLEEAAHRQGIVTGKLEMQKPSKKLLAIHVAPLSDQEGEPVGFTLVLVSDVTALAELGELKSEYVSLVSHELRTPLTSIKGFASTLRAAGPQGFDAQTQEEFLGIIESESDRVLRMINNLLNISKIEAGKALELELSSVDICQVVDTVVTRQRSQTDRHQFRVDCPDHLSPVTADADKLDEILTNLINNAIKYSPEGGEIGIEVKDEGDHLLFGVSDQGIGMSQEQMGKLFQRFQRVVDAQAGISGTGLGLYLVKGFVEAHGGKIWAESEQGKGSTFKFVLPKGKRQEV